MEPHPARRPRIGISSCLLGQKVRYDGGHKRDSFLTETLGAFVEWVGVCPELEVGMGVPRETIRLTGSAERPNLMADKSGKDWTARMRVFSEKRIAQLKALDLSGFILKKDSPSCGMERVRVYGAKGAPNRNGRGAFAAVLLDSWALLPVEEEGRLNDPALRENFIERIFAYRRWRDWLDAKPSLGDLVEFHARQKLVLMAHSPVRLRELGRIVANAKTLGFAQALAAYGRIYMETLALRATSRSHTNVLQHMAGYVSDGLSAEERGELAGVIQDYHRGWVPLIVPVTLMRHHVRRLRVSYLEQQVYLSPHPKELMLRNHV